MQFFPISDWDDAYSNADHIPGGNSYPARWQKQASRFRARLAKEGRAATDLSYGPSERNTLDIFYPACEPRGLAVFIHGGYWMRFDKSYWSHLAEGALEHGWIVAMPSYTLCPDITVSGITVELACAIEFAAGEIAGPIRISGHSVGGHLAARMVCVKTPLKKRIQARIESIVAISPVSDLRPLCCLKMNGTLKLTEAEAARESPSLLTPLPNARVTCWVGASERSEFLRQNLLLAAAWQGLGARVTHVEQPDRHHFDVVEELADPQSELTRAWCA